MKVIEPIIFGCLLIFIGIDVMLFGLLGGGMVGPLTQIGIHKYWMGAVVLFFGVWIVVTVLLDKFKN